MTQSLDSTLPNSSKESYTMLLPWVTWALATLFYLYENIIQVSPGVMVPDLMSAFSINSAALGSLIGVFFYSYATMQIPVGVLVDNYNARFLLAGAACSCIIGCVLFGSATHIYVAALGRLLIGLGAAFGAVCSMKLAANWFPPQRFSLLVGLMVTLGMMGSMLGQKPMALLVEDVGWRHSMSILALVGVVLVALILLIVRHSPQHLGAKGLSMVVKGGEENKSLLRGLLRVVHCSQSWILAIYGGLMFASNSIFGGLWGVPFLMRVHHLSRPTAAGVVAVMFFGWVIGAPLSGVLANLLKSYKKVLWISSVGALTVISIILYIPTSSATLLSVLIFSFGLFCSFFLPSFTLMHDLHLGRNSGAALGFMNTANMIGGAVGQPLIGMLLDLFWNGAMENNVRVYLASDYQYALSCLPIMIAISLFLIPLIKHRDTVEEAESQIMQRSDAIV